MAKVGVRLTQTTLPRGVKALCSVDPDLAAVVNRLGPPPLWGRRPGFSTLLRIVLEQQVSLASANATYLRLQQSLGCVTAHRVAAASIPYLRRRGITRQKADYCRNLAQLVVSRELDLTSLVHADDETARTALCTVKGIGPWTANVYLLMALGRPDVWPPGDIALAEAARQIKGLAVRPKEDRLQQIAAPWTPWRSVAARILWHHYLSVHRLRS